MNTNTTIKTAFQRYLDERRQLGFDLAIAGKQLMRFARYADARGHQGPPTQEIQLDWARGHVLRTGSVTWAQRRANSGTVEPSERASRAPSRVRCVQQPQIGHYPLYFQADAAIK